MLFISVSLYKINFKSNYLFQIIVDANTLENSNIIDSLGDIQINEIPHNSDASTSTTFTNQSLHSDNQQNLSSQISNTLMCDKISVAVSFSYFMSFQCTVIYFLGVLDQ